jgi:hypothetical protein
MKPSSYYDRIVDVMEELVKFTLLTRDCAGYLVDRYSERKETAPKAKPFISAPAPPSCCKTCCPASAEASPASRALT